MTIQYRKMKDLKERTNKVVAEAQGAPVIITNNGKPCAILHSFSEDHAEALILFQSPQVRTLLGRALDDVEAGRTLPLSQYLEAERQAELPRTVEA